MAAPLLPALCRRLYAMYDTTSTSASLLISGRFTSPAAASADADDDSIARSRPDTAAVRRGTDTRKPHAATRNTDGSGDAAGAAADMVGERRDLCAAKWHTCNCVTAASRR